MLKKVNEKKVLHKVKKQWIVLGTALFALGTAGAYSESVHADTTGDNHSSNVVASSSVTTTSSPASGGSSAATTNTNSNATSSGATSSSSTVTSGSTSASQPATTTLQTDNSGQSTANSTVDDDGLSLRVGDDTNTVTNGNASVGSRPTSSTATNVSLVDSEPSYDGSLSNTGTYSYNDGSISITMSVSGSDYATYHKAVDGGYTIQVANSNGTSPFTGINKLVQTVTLSNGSLNQSAVSGSDINKYVTFTSNSAYSASSQSINVSNPDGSGSKASTISLITVSGGPVDSDINGQYYNGDSVTWTLYMDSNSDFNGQTNIYPYVGSTITTTPVQIQYIGTNGSEVKSSEWVTGNNIYPGNTFSVPVSNIDSYQYTGSASVPNGISVSNSLISGTFGNNSAPLKLEYGIPATATVNYHYDNFIRSTNYTGTFIGKTINIKDSIDDLIGKGYKLTTSLASDSIAVSSASNNYDLYFEHATVSYNQSSTSYPTSFSRDDFTKSFTRTINFVDADTSKSISDPVTQTVTYDRSGVYDEVTKTMSYGSWAASDSNSSFAEYTAPSIADYENPQSSSAASQSVDAPDASGSDATPQSSSVTIKYTKSSAAVFNGTVAFLDTDNNNSEVASGSFSGTVGAAVNYSNTVDSLNNQGYQLTSDSPATSFAVKSSDNNYVFKLAHKKATYDASSTSYPTILSKDDFTKSFTRTINFVDADTKQPISNAATQTVSYSRSAVYDEVTKSASYGSWGTNDSSFAAYDAPSIDGYTNPQPTSVAAQSVAAPTSDGSKSTAFSASIAYTKSSAQSYYTPTYTSSVASDAPFIFYSASSSVVSSSSASSVASSSATPSSTSAVKMYNDKTQLVKQDGKILIFIEPKYAPDAGNGSLSNQYVVNRQLPNGQVSHSQEVTLDQYNSMLTASWKKPYTTETLNEAYLRRNSDKNIMKNRTYKTTFDASVVKQGNDVLIDTSSDSNGFSKPTDHKLVVVVYNKSAKNSDSNKNQANKKKSQKKAKRAHKHVKKSEHHVTKHTHHVKHDRKAKK